MSSASEYEMVQLTRQYLQGEGLRVATEVPFLGRSIDLVFERGSTLVAVEFKRRNWRRALHQARDHLLGSDYVYICVPDILIGDTLRMAAAELGIGIYSWTYDDVFSEALSPQLSQTIWTVGREWLLHGFLSRLPKEATRDRI